MELRWKGTTFNHEEFQEAAKLRWVKGAVGRMYHCMIHGDYFPYSFLDIQEGDEPCWQCHAEFEREI